MTKSSSASEFYTYVYRDPLTGNEPIYVGKGKNKRAYEHLTRKDNHPLTRRLAWMARRNTSPDIEIIPALDADHALFMEECLIEMFGRLDKKTGTLCNLTAGGEGHVDWSNENRLKAGIRLKKLHKGVPKTEIQKARMSESGKARFAERRAIELPLFQAAIADPVIHNSVLSSSTKQRFNGEINVYATANKHNINFKRFMRWVKNGCK